MKKIFLLGMLSVMLSNLFAFQHVEDSVVLKAAVITAPKEVNSFDEQALTNYSVDLKSIECLQISSLKDASLTIPNLYVPEYGSKITSSIYVRGIGSRMIEPSIGLYVDDIPYLDKSGFDFDFYDIQSIQFLQGPQGTLYGRNTLGGLLNVTTISPFEFQGTRVNLSIGSYNDFKLGLSHYNKLSDKVGVSVASYYKKNEGYFTNTFNGERNKSESLGGRIKLEWELSKKWSAKMSLSYDQSSENAYPYAQYDTLTNKSTLISYDEKGSYEREMVAGGLCLQREGKNVLFTSSTGYQYLDDQMQIDQDFTSDSIFALSQQQKLHSVTQEFVLRSNNNKRYQWVDGLFGFYKDYSVNAPMTFLSSGIAMLQGYFDAAKAANPAMPAITITNDEMPISGDFKTPTYGLAWFHQSSYDFSKKFSFTTGVRLDYEKTKIDYNSAATMNTSMQVSPSPMVPLVLVDSTYSINGFQDKESWQLLPKISFKYTINDKSTVYTSVTRGYKAGGYNYAMFSDVLQSQMQNQPPVDVEEAISYKPEYSWNYEIGSRNELVKNKLFVDLAIFYIDDNNQQMATFTSHGNRVITNAEKVESYGVEAAMRAAISSKLSFNAAYGYTYATFKKYKVDNVDYAGKIIPFAPQNTLSVSANYALSINKKMLDKIVFVAQYVGVGRTYWNEENSIYQDFYGLLNGEVSLVKNTFQLTGWIKNATETDYNSFYFESLGKSFVQKGRPMMFGVSAKMLF